MTATLATQIEIDARGIAWVAGTAVKVREIVMDKTAHGWSPEEIHFQHPALSMAQIHGALTYYYENQSTLDAEMEADMRQAKELAEAVSDDDLRRRLLASRATR